MNEQDLRDCFAMFLSVGMLLKYKEVDPKIIWEMADEMLEARNKDNNEELGIAAFKPKRQYTRKADYKRSDG
jgi:hypothetical protein